MNQERFDELAQAFATNSISRRQVLKTLAASLLLGMLPAFGSGHAEAQVCTEVGSRCRRNSECCSGICGRKRRRCKCKNSGQSCSEPRNCCSENCCNGRCCNDKQTCENGQCVCDEIYEQCGSACCNPLTEECRNGVCCTPCGSACCNSLTQECRNGVCCKQEGVACSRGSQCCSGLCKDGRCKARPCQHDFDCPLFADAQDKCCQGKCVSCPSGGTRQCFPDGTCGCSGPWCPPSENFPTGHCCPTWCGSPGGCCGIGQYEGHCVCNTGTGCVGPPAKPWPER